MPSEYLQLVRLLAGLRPLPTTKEPLTPRKERPQCGAMCRDGTPCQAPVVWNKAHNAPRNGRCRVHGGLSTGPRTEEGRAAIAESNRRRARAPHQQ